jgi:UDP-N-acetylglucosamine 3-dehydrogenase
MGNVHARQYRKRSDVEIFLFDHNPARSQKFCDAWQIEGFDSFDTLLSRVDVVDICLPTPAHHDYGLKSIAAGRPVFLEKPLARTVSEGAELVAAAAKAEVLLMPGHVLRFFPEYAQARSLVRDGGIGKPAAARARRGGSSPSGDQGWFMDHTKSGGVLLDLCIHDFDWLRWTLGEVKFLYSRSVAIDSMAGPDYALTTLTFENGCVGHVEGTWMDPGGFRTSFEIAGSEGLIQHDSRQNAALRTTAVAPTTEGAPLPNYDGNLAPTDDPYYLELDAFLSAVTDSTPPAITGEDGLRALAISEAAIESAKTGKVVKPASHF